MSQMNWGMSNVGVSGPVSCQNALPYVRSEHPSNSMSSLQNRNQPATMPCTVSPRCESEQYRLTPQSHCNTRYVISQRRDTRMTPLSAGVFPPHRTSRAWNMVLHPCLFVVTRRLAAGTITSRDSDCNCCRHLHFLNGCSSLPEQTPPSQSHTLPAPPLLSFSAPPALPSPRDEEFMEEDGNELSFCFDKYFNVTEPKHHEQQFMPYIY